MKMNQIPVIALDGPSGSGKGTISQLLAQRLGWHFLDSGAIYRALALYLIKHGVSQENEVEIVKLAETLPLRFGSDQGDFEHVWLADNEVSHELRMETTGFLASTIAKIPVVREALLSRQRDFQQLPGLVADGRDMGTVVFESAPLKFFLEASSEERAKRRHKQLQAKGVDVSLDNLLSEINERDKQDRNRSVSPLIPAEDAILLDTTHLSVEAVYQEVIHIIEKRHPDWLNNSD